MLFIVRRQNKVQRGLPGVTDDNCATRDVVTLVLVVFHDFVGSGCQVHVSQCTSNLVEIAAYQEE